MNLIDVFAVMPHKLAVVGSIPNLNEIAM